MNIGIDIDGVLIDIKTPIVDYASKYFIEENMPVKIDVENYSIIDCMPDQEEKFWTKYFITYLKESKARLFASEIVEKLIKDGNKIYIITSRNEDYGVPLEYHGKVKELTKKWLSEQNIKYDKIIFTPDENKLQECINNNIDIMIEDSPENIKSISSKIPVIKYECSYNRKLTGNNIITAYGWYHIYNIITKMKK